MKGNLTCKLVIAIGIALVISSISAIFYSPLFFSDFKSAKYQNYYDYFYKKFEKEIDNNWNNSKSFEKNVSKLDIIKYFEYSPSIKYYTIIDDDLNYIKSTNYDTDDKFRIISLVKRSQNKDVFIQLPYGILKIKYNNNIRGYLVIKILPDPVPTTEIITVVLLSFVVFLILVYIPIQYMVLKPIYQLKNSIERITNGDLSHRCTINKKDDMGILSSSLNLMTERLQEMITSREVLTRNISHELNSPLTRLRFVVETLIERANSDKLLGEYHSMLEDIDELHKLTSQLLDSYMLNNPYALEKQKVNLSEKIIHISEKLEPIAKENENYFTYNVEKNINIHADSQSIDRIFINLFENAIKYSYPKKPIEVSLYKNNNDLIFKLTNYGDGVPDKDKHKIFEPFYRVDKSRSRETGGVGLGLHIVSKLVHYHKGIIYVDSEENKNTTFVINFPASILK